MNFLTMKEKKMIKIKDLLGETEKIVKTDKEEKKRLLNYLKHFEDYKLADIRKIEEEYYKGMFCGTEYKYHYIVELHGGDNGKADWNKYLFYLSDMFNPLHLESWNIESAWMIQLINDSYADTHTIFVGFRMK